MSELRINADSGAIKFGADYDIELTHNADKGLILKHTATADDKPVILTLQTGETDMAANDVMGKIEFQAPDEGTGTDAILVAAGIQAVSEGDFSSSSNATRLEFMTGASEAATTQMTISSGGIVGIGATLPGDLGTGLHIKTADSGASATSHGDELVIEDGTSGANVGISILSATDGEGRINFGDSGDNDIGMIRYNHADDSMTLITSNANGLVIDSTGAVTKPLQPAFAAEGSGTTTNPASGAQIVFDTEIYDVNGDFASNTFTAPVTGKYQLNVSVRYGNMDADSTYNLMQLTTSNRAYYHIMNGTCFDSDVTYKEFNISMIADMDANDTADVAYAYSGGAQQTDMQTRWFTGALIC